MANCKLDDSSLMLSDGTTTSNISRYIEQKLVGTGYTGLAQQGYSVSLSADGNYLAVGARGNNSSIGATWVYVRSNSTWVQQAMLVGTGNTGASNQGSSVSLNSDGTYLAVGGQGDNSNVGATWIFTRSGSSWSQQQLLIGTGNTGSSAQGHSVYLNSDATYLAVGGPNDNVKIGATWIFTRSGTSWSQQSMLIGTGYTNANQGTSVSLNIDGTYLAIGGPGANGGVGATWIFTRSGISWSQQTVFVGTGYTGTPNQGCSVSLNSDASYIAVGGFQDNGNIGATWIFTRSGTSWSQQTMLIGTGYINLPEQGYSVSLNSDASFLAIGGPQDNSNIGAIWLFGRSGTTWTQIDEKIGTGNISTAKEGSSVSISSAGHYIAVGGPSDNSVIGATWVYNSPYPDGLYFTSTDAIVFTNGSLNVTNLNSPYINSDSITVSNLLVTDASNGSVNATNASIANFVFPDTKGSNFNLNSTTISNLISTSTTNTNLNIISGTIGSMSVTNITLGSTSNTICSGSATFTDYTETTPDYGLAIGNGAQSLLNGTGTFLTNTFWNGTITTIGRVSFTNGAFVVPSGYYYISYNISFAANATGSRLGNISISSGDTQGGSTTYNAVSGDRTTIAGSFITGLNTNDTISIVAQQTSGSSLSMDTGVQSYLSVIRLY